MIPDKNKRINPSNLWNIYIYDVGYPLSPSYCYYVLSLHALHFSESIILAFPIHHRLPAPLLPSRSLQPPSLHHAPPLHSSLSISCPQPSQAHSDLLINFFLPTEVSPFQPALSLSIDRPPLQHTSLSMSPFRTSPYSTSDIHIATSTNLLLGRFINMITSILRHIVGLFQNRFEYLGWCQALQRFTFHHQQPC